MKPMSSKVNKSKKESWST